MYSPSYLIYVKRNTIPQTLPVSSQDNGTLALVTSYPSCMAQNHHTNKLLKLSQLCAYSYNSTSTKGYSKTICT